ncbi:MAG TPA: pyruvate kinase [Tepidisphaeraceae bacterium]|nr:pyruvate kinase [Tepidisphaeraceae bacterium]
MIRTKIVATMGPASSGPDVLMRLFEEGMDVCRLNFSHGDMGEHLKTLKVIREVAARRGQTVAVLGDLGGPKIRLGKIEDVDGTGGMPIGVGDVLHFVREPVLGRNLRVSTTYPNFVDDVKVGDRILIEDGLIRCVAIDKKANEVLATCTSGGVIKSAKGINLPNTAVSIPSITDRDWQCVDWAVEHDLDFLALSFVRRPEDLTLLREHLHGKRSAIDLIAKIEKSEALTRIDDIIDVSDGLMIARGDLGVEMDLAQVPIIQKDLIKRCQCAGKPVIVATQMLQSMIEQSSPTRAEVSDVANAIYDGADAIMLSGETSVGKYPVATVHVMNHVAEVTEEYLITQSPELQPAIKVRSLQLSGAVARGVWQIVRDLKVKLLAVWSQTGTTARIFSKYRFPVPIIAFSSDRGTLRQMAIHFGVIPQEMTAPADITALIAQVDAFVREKQYAAESDRIVIVAGAALGTPGTMDGIIIHTVGTLPVAAERRQIGDLETT